MAANGGGAIVNLSSGGARAAHRGMVAYDASKGGVEAMTRALALDLAPYGIRVNALAPGAIDVWGLDEEERARRGETVPLGRVGTPDDLAGPAVFLASDDARYVTGVVISVDGGLLAQQRSPQVDIFPLSRFPRISRA
jgi:3-oxoacyl-[acyl-carrier protein] reductase